LAKPCDDSHATDGTGIVEEWSHSRRKRSKGVEGEPQVGAIAKAFKAAVRHANDLKTSAVQS
jgi:hypothetical protein